MSSCDIETKDPLFSNKLLIIMLINHYNLKEAPKPPPLRDIFPLLQLKKENCTEVFPARLPRCAGKKRVKGLYKRSDEARERSDDVVFVEARLITKAHLSVIPLRWMRSPVGSRPENTLAFGSPLSFLRRI
ncbi:hypothetical protein CDAR_235831 [Caerostris darwini]|uniref:Uncharacterized protein n=1 Tax=Caerostris darwini TaxID=1538125 RepID=A0AAV4WG78_9ARAC|nr:hypothetical protein CDAR_235831 [Caerostris darwini]